ncbi:MAG: ABC-type transport auxiliary lipoprotein family protein [Alphaproteobacteria bacterium]
MVTPSFFRNFALAGLLLCALVGCGGLSLLDAEEAAIYDLSPKSTFDGDLPNVEAQLVIEEPTASSSIDTNRIAVRVGQFQVSYIEGVRWSDRSTLMFQTRLIESFENSERITAVGRKAIGLSGDYDLLTELREFEAQEKESGPPEVVVVVNAKLISQPRAQIEASETFRRRTTVSSERFEDIIGGYDDALGGVMKRIVSWTLVEIEKAEQRRMEVMDPLFSDQ